MNNAKRFFLFAASSFVLLAGMAAGVSAQTPQPSPVRRDQILITPNDQIRITPRDRVLETEATRLSAPPYSVRGKIRWRKEYGVIPMGPGNSQPAVYPCGVAYFVAAMKTVGAPGSFGRLTTVAYTPDLPNKITEAPDEGGYYVCNYIIPNLPTNTNLLIMAGMGGVLLLPEMSRDPYYWTAPWIGGSQPQPPPGYERAFIGSRSVTLTDGAPRATVDFELVYRPIATPPR